MKRPKPLSELLQSGDIGRLAARAKQHSALTAEVKSRLSAAEAEHLVSARNNEEGELVIAMDSPAWATRVRYRVRELWRRPVRITVVPKPGR